ncbi:TIGR02611 family protein [Mycetocola zhujimingii]|uniref:TIGR02611 family protein n=2 Tax=Mycetocola zhujimingii TaxID=2079792 RepID=A0A2U1TCA1_9MICO|nr:TIGR02611 family protein [Mycetocola zhujimingii]PWC06515.1 TIGR02611 family protein [Mycetocola zhujimingii]
MLRRARAWIDDRPRLRHAYRTGVGILGGLIAVVGLVLVPLPGPGWLVVFLGLAILGTEFAWAKRLAAFVKRQLSRFWAWWNSRKSARATS